MENKMTKNFNEVGLGSKYTVNGVEYIKINEIKVSCCRSINAQVSNDPNNRTFFTGDTSVIINA